MTVPRPARTALASLLLAALSAAGAPALAGGASAAGPPAPGGVASGGVLARLDPEVPTTGNQPVRVVVRALPGAGSAAQDAVRHSGGRVARELPLVDGFAATLPARAVPALAATPGVRGVSADRAVWVQSGTWEDGGAQLAPQVLRAPQAWEGGATGRGVTVAVLDTGVAEVPDLAGRIVPVTDDGTGRTAACHDLSGEGSCADSFGHGTFMAGLVVGDGASSGDGSGAGATGTAPEARVLSVKVAGADGAADVSTVLAGLQWVVSFRERYDIRVVNLSLGTDSTQSWEHDPLNYAVERAWNAGLVVVVAAANTGPVPGSIAKPGDDPWVVTVGATDAQGTPGTGDDRLPDFSSRGPTRDGVAKPDVVAPGARVVSLRAPGSTLDREYPPADEASPYRTGTGTSMSAALVSGVVASTLQAHPGMAPDEVKHALVAAARPVASDDPSAVGAGLVDAAHTALTPPVGRANVGLGRSSGLGDLGASRGTLSLQLNDPLATLLTGRQTAQLVLWDPLAYATGSWTPSTWYSSVHGTLGWNTASWAGPTGSLTGNNWTGNNWTGSSWYDQHDERPSYGRHGPGSASYGAWE